MQSAGYASRRRGAGFGGVLFAALLAAAPAFAQSPDALERYRQGTAALEAGRFDEARRHFSEAVAIDPEFPGAWLDLAVAAARAGDAVQAEEFLDILEARFELPDAIVETVAALRARLSAMLARPEGEAGDRAVGAGTVADGKAPPAPGDAAMPTAAAGWRWQRSVQAGIGHDSNANAGLALGSLTLTLPGGNVVLPVDEAFLPRADFYSLLAAGAVAERRSETGIFAANASLRWRRNVNERDYDALELRGGLAWTSAMPLPANGLFGLMPGPWRVSTSFQQVRLGANALQNSAAVAFEHVWPQAACKPLGGLELDYRVHPVARSLDATYLWLGVALRCPGLPMPWARQLQAQLRIGQAFAREDGGDRARPGGDSRHLELSLLHEWAWARRAGGENRLQARLQLERVRDTEGYSPLLAGNATREVTRGAVGLAWLVPIGAPDGPWQAVLDLQRFRQRSNLEVFDLSGRLLQLSLQRNW